MKSKPIEICDLPKYSRWPAILLGLETFKYAGRKKTREEVLREYDRDKYGLLLRRISVGPYSISQVAQDYRGGHPNQNICISRSEQLFETKVGEAYAEWEKLMINALAHQMEQCDTVIEFGAGLGLNLAALKKRWPHHRYIGLDISPNGVAVAKKLYYDIEFHVLDLNAKRWQVFEDLPKKTQALVLTVHAVEYVPTASIFFQTIRKYKKNLRAVANFEPLFSAHSEASLLGLLRRRYIQFNNYTQDIIEESKRAKVQIIRKESDFYGINPLFPTGLLLWHF